MEIAARRTALAERPEVIRLTNAKEPLRETLEIAADEVILETAAELATEAESATEAELATVEGLATVAASEAATAAAAAVA
jgi:hypothetical protein